MVPDRALHVQRPPATLRMPVSDLPPCDRVGTIGAICAAVLPILSAGRTMPATSPEVVLTAIDISRRPVEFDEPGWLAYRYERGDGDRAIARELGVTRKMVTAERGRQGIASRPPGRPRGPAVPMSALLIAARIREQSRATGPAPTYDLLLGRLAEIDRAHRAGETHAEEDAIIELAAACGLVFDHLRRLRAA